MRLVKVIDISSPGFRMPSAGWGVPSRAGGRVSLRAGYYAGNAPSEADVTASCCGADFVRAVAQFGHVPGKYLEDRIIGEGVCSEFLDVYPCTIPASGAILQTGWCRDLDRPLL